MTKRVALLLVIIAALLLGAFAWLSPRMPVKVGMTEAEVTRVLGQENGRIAPRTKFWFIGKAIISIDFDENGRVIAVNDDGDESLWERFQAWLGLVP
jgi:hypothetical protein